MLVIINFTPVVLICSINTQFFVHDKSSSMSQFSNGKSRNPPKLLRYLSGIVTSTFKVAEFASPAFPGCGGLSGVFRVIFVLYLIDVTSETLSSTSILSV